MFTPRYRFAGVLALFAFLLAACSKDVISGLTEVRFSKSYTEIIDLTINPNSTQEQPLPISVPIPSQFTRYKFATGIDQIAAENNTSADKLISVQVDTMFLKAISPAGQTLNFVDTIRVYATGDSLPDVLVASKVPMPKNGSQMVYMDITGVNLKPYFVKDSLGLSLRGSLSAIPPAGTKLEFGTVFRVVANPLN